MEFSKLKQNFSLRISTPKHFPFDVAQTLQKDLEELCKKHDEVFVCLSGGQTPLETYKILGSDFYNSISWQNIVFFVGDERVTDIEHDINSFNIRKSFSIDTLRLVDWYGNNSRLSIEYFNETLARLGVVENGFHLLLLGLGEDGHLAGLFPGSNYDDLVVCESMVPS
ncbi:MAG: 6-phosphogluconolactonase, partial [Deltaproteobacteria bacterium]|nr:6-phosphogluconolactonase [Deltaproteobacteria bacterium]